MTTTRRRTSSTRRARAPRSVPVTNAPLVRLPRVRSAQKRIESGFYDRRDVRNRLANAVLQVILQG
jgi:hypothetical protein